MICCRHSDYDWTISPFRYIQRRPSPEVEEDVTFVSFLNASYIFGSIHTISRLPHPLLKTINKLNVFEYAQLDNYSLEHF